MATFLRKRPLPAALAALALPAALWAVRLRVTAPAPPAAAAADAPIPPDRVEAIPVPPMQNAPWALPPSKVPAAFVSAARRLFRDGVADPRGCEYRAVRMRAEQGDPSRVITENAWVLPPAAGARRRWAVAWDGVTYPVAVLGRPADVRDDVAKAFRDPGNLGATGPGQAMAGVLLLRLGHGDLAARVYRVWSSQWSGYYNPYGQPGGRDYAYLYGMWRRGVVERAMEARRRGDDALALAAFRPLAQEAMAARAQERLRVDLERSPEDEEDYSAAPECFADLERRAREPARRPGNVDALVAISDGRARIAALIRELDQVTAGDGSNLLGDSVVQALVDEGDAAVEPLLDAMANDKRLTRCDGSYDEEGVRAAVPVWRAAEDALRALLVDTPIWPNDLYSGRGGAPQPREVAAAVREAWKKLRGLPLEERWYRLLADDHQPPETWLAVIEKITAPPEKPRPHYAPRSYIYVGYDQGFWGRGRPIPRPRRRTAGGLGGEALRRLQRPSVMELIARRAVARAREPMGGFSYQGCPLHDACVMALAAARWDRQAAVPLLQAVCARYRKVSQGMAGSDLAHMVLARAAGGDTTGFREYADWMRANAASLSGDWATAVRPLWSHPDDPQIRALNKWLFVDGASPWRVGTGTPAWPGGISTPQLAQTPLLGVPGFRQALLTALGDRTYLGTATCLGSYNVRLKYGTAFDFVVSDGEAYSRRPHPAVRFRRCDDTARCLRGIGMFPWCQLFWPKARRDQVVAKCAAVLRRYGPRYRYVPEHEVIWDDPYQTPPTPAYPALGRPATPEDVAKGRAIFSLAGQGETRLCRLPSLPMRAWWSKAPPQALLVMDTMEGIPRPVTQRGAPSILWQAEEVRTPKGWRRYYGLVGPGGPVKAPAEEVWFPPAGYDQSPFGGAPPRLRVGYSLELPEFPPAAAGGYPSAMAAAAPGEPLQISLRLRNWAGLDGKAPAEFARREADGSWALLQGVRLTLQYQEPARPTGLWGEMVPGKWRNVRPRADRHLPAGATHPLAAGEECEALRLDLRELFDLSRPGPYQLSLTMAPATGVYSDWPDAVTFRVLAHAPGS